MRVQVCGGVYTNKTFYVRHWRTILGKRLLNSVYFSIPLSSYKSDPFSPKKMWEIWKDIKD